MMLWRRTGLLGSIVTTLLVSNCAGTDTQLRILENQNALQIEPSQTKDFDYVVRIKNLMDIGYDPDNRATRSDTALRAIRAQCPEATIVGERIIEKGTYLLKSVS
jgi:hypothetical protein